MLNKQCIHTRFCVIGGGLAGLCAAVAAAREGIPTVLMQERPVLGGNASSEIRMWICGAHGEGNRETGIMEEICLKNLYRNPTKNYYLWDTVLLELALEEKNLTLLLNCTCMDAETETGDFPHGRNIKINNVTGYQMTTQTMVTVYADFFADCSGDSILAPLVKAAFRYGREGKDDHGEPTHVVTPDDLTMGMSCLLQGRETQRTVPFIPPTWSTPLTAEHFQHRNPNLQSSWENFWYLELGGNRDTVKDTEAIAKDLIPLALGTWNHIKNSGLHDADRWELEFLGFLPGKRESRRMLGEYIITANDILENTKFDDVVAYGGWPIDDHFPDGFYHKGSPNTNILPEAPYQIPYRCLYSKNVSNLFFAGRNISMTHMAMSSIRVMATCSLLGQAIGTAAAVAATYELPPHGVYLERMDELQERLLAADCYLPGKARTISELCRSTDILNGARSLKDGHDRPNPTAGYVSCGVSVKNGTPLTYILDTPSYITWVHIVFDSDLDRTTLPGDVCERTHAMRANVRLDSPVMHMPLTLCRSFSLECLIDDSYETIVSHDNNLRRFYHIPLHRRIKALRLTPLANWGNTNETRIFSFDFGSL